jgi:hypothetical protein
MRRLVLVGVRPKSRPDLHAKGQNNCVEGQNNCADGQNNCVEGQNNCAEGQNNCAEGRNTCVEGRNTCVEGQNTCAEGTHEYSWMKNKCEKAKKIFFVGKYLGYYKAVILIP